MALFSAVPELPQAAPVLYAALAFLALLQVTALIFNLIPCPGLDGWGIIEPFLPAPVRALGRRVGADRDPHPRGRAVLRARLNRWFWQTVFAACALIGLDAARGVRRLAAVPVLAVSVG